MSGTVIKFKRKKHVPVLNDQIDAILMQHGGTQNTMFLRKVIVLETGQLLEMDEIRSRLLKLGHDPQMPINYP